jgi:hypothetical protein
MSGGEVGPAENRDRELEEDRVKPNLELDLSLLNWSESWKSRGVRGGGGGDGDAGSSTVLITNTEVTHGARGSDHTGARTPWTRSPTTPPTTTQAHPARVNGSSHDQLNLRVLLRL